MGVRRPDGVWRGQLEVGLDAVGRELEGLVGCVGREGREHEEREHLEHHDGDDGQDQGSFDARTGGAGHLTGGDDRVATDLGAERILHALPGVVRHCSLHSVDPREELRDQSCDPQAARSEPDQHSNDEEDGKRSQSLIDPVAAKHSHERGDQQEEGDLREQGKVGAQPAQIVHEPPGNAREV